MRPRRAEASAGRWRCPRLLPLALACIGLPAAAQQNPGDPSSRTVALEPRLSVVETLTDNHLPGDSRGEADAVTRVTAGLGWRGRSGLVRGFADYALTGVVHARHSDRNELQNALNANVVADLIDDRLQLLGSAVIARTALSAFGPQPGLGGVDSTNVTETRTLQLAPTLRGPLGRSVRYRAALAHTLTSSADARQGDSTSTVASLHLEPAERSRLGWTLDATRLDSDFELGRRTQSDRLYGGLGYDVEALDLRLSATAGTERTNIASLDSRRYSTWGAGLRWTPSPVTRVDLEIEERFFGRSHQVLIEHRLPRTVFTLRGSRSLSTNGSQLVAERSTWFNAYYNDPLLVSRLPDARAREAAVLEALRILNKDPNEAVNIGALRSAATLQDLLEFTTLWTAPRQTLQLSISRTTSRRVDTLSSAVDDFTLVDRIRSSYLVLTGTHRLTPLTGLTLQLSTQRSATDRADLSSRQTQAQLLLSTRLSPDSTAGVALRRLHVRTGAQSADETALTASYGVRF